MEKKEWMEIIRKRFEENGSRHPQIEWHDVERVLRKSEKTVILMRMEEAGGEPDVVEVRNGAYVFFDCSPEVPLTRRSICYDEEARLKRKLNRPESSAEKMAEEIGAQILDEEDYLFLQTLGDFDRKTQSWVKTDADFRSHGEALFGGKRHGRTFLFYNGADAYYKTRGFRCKLIVE